MKEGIEAPRIIEGLRTRKPRSLEHAPPGLDLPNNLELLAESVVL
jgi:hypothetical protein